jgi:queuine/archaeosine tRNA-ribosyltransferase
VADAVAAAVDMERSIARGIDMYDCFTKDGYGDREEIVVGGEGLRLSS